MRPSRESPRPALRLQPRGSWPQLPGAPPPPTHPRKGTWAHSHPAPPGGGRRQSGWQQPPESPGGWAGSAARPPSPLVPHHWDGKALYQAGVCVVSPFQHLGHRQPICSHHLAPPLGASLQVADGRGVGPGGRRRRFCRRRGGRRLCCSRAAACNSTRAAACKRARAAPRSRAIGVHRRTVAVVVAAAAAALASRGRLRLCCRRARLLLQVLLQLLALQRHPAAESEPHCGRRRRGAACRRLLLRRLCRRLLHGVGQRALLGGQHQKNGIPRISRPLCRGEGGGRDGEGSDRSECGSARPPAWPGLAPLPRAPTHKQLPAEPRLQGGAGGQY